MFSTKGPESPVRGVCHGAIISNCVILARSIDRTMLKSCRWGSDPTGSNTIVEPIPDRYYCITLAVKTRVSTISIARNITWRFYVSRCLGQDRFGVLIGSGIGGVEFFEDNCAKFNKAGGKGPGLKKVSFPGPCTTAKTTRGNPQYDFVL